MLHGSMKAIDLKPDIDWNASDPFAGIRRVLSPAYAAEPKLDGVRVEMVMDDAGNQVATQNMRVSRNFPHLHGAIIAGMSGTILDCELLAPARDSGLPLLTAATSLVMSEPRKAIAKQHFNGQAQLHIFDVLRIGTGTPVTQMSYAERGKLLDQICAEFTRVYPSSGIRQVPRLPATPRTLHKLLDQGYEGAMLKLRAAPYVSASRGPHWYKLKGVSTTDAFVTGWRPGEGHNSGKVGSFEISVMLNGEPVPVGHVGNFTHAFRELITGTDGTLKPVMYGKVVEVMAQALSKDGKLRHPLMMRLRPDKTQEDCQAEQLAMFTRV